MENTHPKLLSITPDGDSRIDIGRLSKADSASPTEVTLQEKQLLADPAVLKSHADSAGISRKVTLELLINRLNLTHFQDDCIQVSFAHRRYVRSLLVPAFPQPCLDGVLECRWAHPADMPAVLKSFDLAHILVPRGQRFIHAVPAVIEINAEGAFLALPDVSH